MPERKENRSNTVIIARPGAYHGNWAPWPKCRIGSVCMGEEAVGTMYVWVPPQGRPLLFSRELVYTVNLCVFLFPEEKNSGGFVQDNSRNNSQKKKQGKRHSATSLMYRPTGWPRGGIPAIDLSSARACLNWNAFPRRRETTTTPQLSNQCYIEWPIASLVPKRHQQTYFDLYFLLHFVPSPSLISFLFLK